MAAPSFIRRHLNQTLVYWGDPEDDGYGGYTFDDPVEINGRCEFKNEVVVSAMGEELVSRAHVYLEQEVNPGGYLYLGSLTDSVMESAPVPTTTEGSMKILIAEKLPQLDGPGFLYKAYVNMEH